MNNTTAPNFRTGHAPRRYRDRLSQREVACVELTHLSNGDIAQALGISIHTVNKHLQRAYMKLGAETRTGAFAALLRKGLQSEHSEALAARRMGA